MNGSDPIGHSITKKFRKDIWNPMIGAIRQYQLLRPGDRVAVCVSGGKDSMLLAKCFQLLQKYSDFPFEVVNLSMDPGYNAENRQRIADNADRLGLTLETFRTRIFDVVDAQGGSPCYLCARMRRGWLYRRAQELGCTKIALGHHMDDVIETTLMSMFYGAEIRTMLPKLHSAHYGGMALIRPLYLVREEAVRRWARANGLEFIRCACRISERNDRGEDASRRQAMKRLIAQLGAQNANVPANIFHSMAHVNLDTVLGWCAGGESHTFLDAYDDWDASQGGTDE